jgi:hypothetical protein
MTGRTLGARGATLRAERPTKARIDAGMLRHRSAVRLAGARAPDIAYWLNSFLYSADEFGTVTGIVLTSL